jgi:hypothetical protein
MASIGGIIKAGISAGKTDDAILADVFKEHPNANTKVASIRWYRSQMRKETGTATAPPKRTKAAEAVKKATSGSDPLAGASERWKQFKRAAGIPEGMDEVPAGQPAYSVTFKPTTGMEGSGFLAKLYHYGKHVADANDYGDGGPVHFTWLDHKEPQVDVVTTNWKEEEHTYKGTPEEAAFAAYCRSLPKYVCRWSEDKTPRFVTPDLHVEEMVNDLELRKQLKKLCKKIAYITGDGKLYTVSAPPTEENIKKYVTAHNASVLNTMDEAEALAWLKKLQG